MGLTPADDKNKQGEKTMGTLNDRKFKSMYKDVSTGTESYAADTASATEYASGVAGKYTSSLPTLTNNDWGFLRLTSDGKLMVDTELTLDGNIIIDNVAVWATNIADSSTTSFALVDANGHPQVDVLTMPGSLTGYAEDTAHTTGDIGILSLVVRQDSASALAGTDGDYIPLSVNAAGWLRTVTLAEKSEDTAHTTGDVGNFILGVRADTQTSFSGTDGDYTPLSLSQYGELTLRGYDYSTNGTRVEEIDPVSAHHVEETLADVTNGADDTYYYYFDMDGFQHFAAQFTLNGGSGTCTVTVEATIQDDGTAPASCTYVDITLDEFGVANFTASDIIIGDTSYAFKYVRYKVVAATGAADDADWTIYNKKMY